MIRTAVYHKFDPFRVLRIVHQPIQREMEENEEPDDDDLTNYAVQFSIQESLESERSQQPSPPMNETRYFWQLLKPVLNVLCHRY